MADPSSDAASSLPQSGQQRRVVVIGAGLGGLACAIRLLAAGFQVTVLEAQPQPGGRAGRIQEAGFTFDTGPSLITLPGLIEELFALAGDRMERRLRLHRLDPFYRISWYGEPRSFTFSGNRDRMIGQIGGFDAQDAVRYDAFLEAGRQIYEQAILVAGRRSFLHLRDFLAFAPRMVRLGALRSVDGLVGAYFRDPHIRQAFGFHSLFIGGDPFRVPAVYAALAYLQIAEGVWYSEGGVFALVEALAGLVTAGGHLELGRRAVEVVHDGSRIRGVRTEDGETVEAEYVVSNADVTTTQRCLLKRRGREPRQSMSCYLLYLGTSAEYPHLQHHTLLVGKDYHGFIRDATRDGKLSEDICLYLHVPSRTERAMAAPGGESVTALLPVPNLQAPIDWETEEADVRERVLDALEGEDGLGMTGLRDRVAVERSWTPDDFRDRLGATDGNAFGPEPTLFQSASFRQPNRDRDLRGMYYVGAGTHPGAGIPGVLLSAEVTSRLLIDDAREARR